MMFHSDIYYHHHLFLYFLILFNYLFHSIFFEADTVSATIDDDDAHKKNILFVPTTKGRV